MKPLAVLLCLCLASLTVAVRAEPIPVNGVDHNGFGGVYEINGENYWWMCVEPNGSTSAGLGESFIADALTFAEGWTQQTLERYVYYNVTNPDALTTVVPKQVAVMEYVLDTYLPWDTLAGASGRFAEQDSSSANYDNDDPFYNSFFAVQNFLSEMYGKEAQSDFATDLSVNFMDYFAGDPSAAATARSAIFQSILDDVEAKDGAGFFDSYTAQHAYFIANTSYPEGDPNNWQDALVIQSFAPIPEPSGALLIGCFGVVVLLRRCRRAGHTRTA
ncbi:MAG TPA: hypothetical protein VD994_04905 [Prosthecobacter sp.]|nr:hypothetical protein [Prosthecobacter sp.]